MGESHSAIVNPPKTLVGLQFLTKTRVGPTLSHSRWKSSAVQPLYVARKTFLVETIFKPVLYSMDFQRKAFDFGPQTRLLPLMNPFPSISFKKLLLISIWPHFGGFIFGALTSSSNVGIPQNSGIRSGIYLRDGGGSTLLLSIDFCWKSNTLAVNTLISF